MALTSFSTVSLAWRFKRDLGDCYELIDILELSVSFDIREGNCVTVRVGTVEVDCSVKEIDPVSLRVLECKPEVLGEGDVGKVVFRASEPVCIEAYKDMVQLGRFVIIRRTGTTAAGVVMDVSKMEGICEKD